MNPSASGWIDKFGHLVNQWSNSPGDFYSVYRDLRTMGFTYGMNVSIPDFVEPAHKLTQDEMAKINLLYGLYATYVIHRGNGNFNAFLKEVFEFYQDLDIGRISFLEKILSGSKTSAQLERLLDSRIHLDTNVLTRSFNSLLTNTMLFVDVLTLEAYLVGRGDLQRYARNLEYLSINIAYQALSSREEQPEEDRLRELFKASMTFMEDPLEEVDLGYRNMLTEYKRSSAAPYFLDLACLAVWEDARLQGTESDFVAELGKELGFAEEETQQALVEVTAFLGNHSGELQIFRREKFYDGVSSLVGKLIRRNSKRLQKELSQSRDLVFLLSKSTVKDLSAKEREQVQNQLLDIFKSIPSLAIFMLPGGAILLPIFIKLIPKLLPSSFDENRVDKK
ncbi:LETM1-like protein [Robiginitalea myxolifaciens]|uniref:LETM1-like protein n=1 Tax=Robiginitalea myxolifaciens TaxID=400055 RepID=A0A1I6FMW1_9FLAO|nr:LETM1-related biofilm-associated protein [Robiginitalea myxolifaciens]SFR31271.1 LETM1-like protein [Robiginitalea myxolifaciens]